MFKRLLLTVAVAALALLFGFGSTSYILASNTRMPHDKPVLAKKFSGWEYRAFQAVYATGRTSPRITVSVESTLHGRSELEQALREQRREAERLFQTHGQIAAVAIPDTPLAPEQLRAFASRHAAQITGYTMIAESAEGEIITLFGAPKGDEIFPDSELASLTQSIEANQHTTLTLRGIVAISASVDAAAFAAISQDAQILGIDITSAIASDDLAKAQQIDPAQIDIIPAPIYWANVAK